MAQRQYESATVFNCRCVDMRHLWEPSREFKGQPTQKPNYFGMFIVPKTQAQWHAEPTLAGIAAACGKIWNTPQGQHVLQWPIVDGDQPSPEGKTSDFAKGHWLFSASTGSPPNIELAQAGGALVKLPGRAGVKPGDYCMAGVTAAIKQNDARGVKLYLNAVVFTAPGEEIVFANSVSGAELMRLAQQQGMTVAGFAPSAGGFGGGGFAPPQQAQQPFGAPPAGGFTHGNPAPGQSVAPMTANPANPAFGAPAHGGMPNGAGGNVTFPSNAAPGPFAGQSFAAPPRGPFG